MAERIRLRLSLLKVNLATQWKSQGLNLAVWLQAPRSPRQHESCFKGSVAPGQSSPSRDLFSRFCLLAVSPGSALCWRSSSSPFYGSFLSFGHCVCASAEGPGTTDSHSGSPLVLQRDTCRLGLSIRA